MSSTPPPLRQSAFADKPDDYAPAPDQELQSNDRASRDRSGRPSTASTPGAQQKQQQQQQQQLQQQLQAYQRGMQQNDRDFRTEMNAAMNTGMQPAGLMPRFAHEPYDLDQIMRNQVMQAQMMQAQGNAYGYSNLMMPPPQPMHSYMGNAPSGVFLEPAPAHPRRHSDDAHVSTDQELGVGPRPTSFQQDDFDLRDINAPPPPPPEGKGLMNNAKMFTSSRLNKSEMLFLDGARWALSNESVPIEIYNFDSKVFYTPAEVRQSIVALLNLIGFDEECVTRTLPVSKSASGPWQMMIAAQAAKALMDNEDQLSIIPYDTDDGRPEGEVQVRMLTPHGKPYPGAEDRPPMRTRDNSLRISCFLDLPITEQLLDDAPRNEMRTNYKRGIEEHFATFGGHRVGFLEPYNEEGDPEPKLTVFVHHPKETTRKDFIRAAFPKIKYFDIGLSEPAKFKLRKEDIVVAGIKMCCFLPECVSNPRLPAHHCAAQMNLAAEMGAHGPTRPPAIRTPKADTGPSVQQRDLKRKNMEDTASKFALRACRAHALGRCVFTSSECTAMHYEDPKKIDCNSSIQPGDVRYTNNRFGICRNFVIGRACPYAKCDATLQANGPPSSASADDAMGGEKAPPPSPDAAADGNTTEDMT